MYRASCTDDLPNGHACSRLTLSETLEMTHSKSIASTYRFPTHSRQSLIPPVSPCPFYQNRPEIFYAPCFLSLYSLQANQSAIPVTLQTNYSYGYLPRGLDSQFQASSAPEGGGFVSSLVDIAGTATACLTSLDRTKASSQSV